MGATFVPPAEGPVAFRRDRIPLDVDAMARLSRQLVVLARGVEAESATGMRAAAQMLAISTALDPANNEAREVMAQFQKAQHQPLKDAAALEKSRALVWQYLSWLETPAAGDQGQALAACLTDVIAVADPGHPKAKSIRGAAEVGAWSGWVPPLAAYESSAKASSEEMVAAEPPSAEPAPVTPGVLLSEAEVATPLWRPIPKSVPKEWVLAPCPLSMSAEVVEPDGAPNPGTLAIGPQQRLAELGQTLVTLLREKHGALPPNARVVIGGSALEASMESGKRQSLSAAAAVLADSALTGREPTGTIIGTVDETGALNLPMDFWNHLHSLENGEGGRLVLPAAASEYLLSVLALEKPEFFLKYEVLLAANFDQMIALAEKNPGEAIAKSMMKFGEIRSKAAGQPVGQYLANSYVRRRLAELAQEAPYHYSAKMLAMQGAGNRPVSIPRQVMVPELRRAIAPMDWLVHRGANDFDAEELARLAPTYETCRSQVDRMNRYAEKGDRDLISHVVDMLALIRTLDRTARTRGEPGVVNTSIRETHQTLLTSYKGIARELAVAAGEPVEEETPPER